MANLLGGLTTFLIFQTLKKRNDDSSFLSLEMYSQVWSSILLQFTPIETCLTKSMLYHIISPTKGKKQETTVMKTLPPPYGPFALKIV